MLKNEAGVEPTVMKIMAGGEKIAVSVTVRIFEIAET